MYAHAIIISSTRAHEAFSYETGTGNPGESELARALTRLEVRQCPPLARLAFPYVIFDMDGTLVDTLGLITDAFNYAASKYLPTPLNVDQALFVRGRTLGEQFSNFVPSREVAAAVELYYRYFEGNFDSRVVDFGGIQELLFSLVRRGVRIAVFTGASRRSANYVLRWTGLFPFFEFVLTADDVNESKPNPEGLLKAKKLAGVASEQIVYVGDHPNDVIAARAAGIRSASALWASRLVDELSILKPDFVFRQPSEVLGLTQSSRFEQFGTNSRLS